MMNYRWERLFALVSFLSCGQSKMFTLKASRTVSRPLNIPIETFREWFSMADTPTNLVLLNPGVERIDIITPTCHRGLLRPIKFPWTTIKCSIDYDLKFIKGRSLAVTCREDAVTQIFEGSKAFVDAMSSLKLLVAGSADFYIDEPSSSFCVGVAACVSFPVPDYYPDVILKSMQAAGAAVLQSKVEYDLGKLLENTLSSCSVWAAETSIASTVPLVDMRSRQLKKVAA